VAATISGSKSGTGQLTGLRMTAIAAPHGSMNERYASVAMPSVVLTDVVQLASAVVCVKLVTHL
jgi:hypothetical protein